MSSVLEDFLEVVDRRSAEPGTGASDAGQLAVLEEEIYWHVAILESLERRIGFDGVTEVHRPLVPLYQRWMLVARRLFRVALDLRRRGHTVAGLDDLAFGINRAKPAAEAFDYWVERNAQLARGEFGPTRTLDEVMDELRDKA